MEIITETNELVLPSLLDKRWKEIKTAMYKLIQSHSRDELILTLIKLRERHTSTPTLSEITKFTGFDVAIHTIQRWDWKPANESRSIEIDAAEIGKYGAELMVVHTLRESIRNDLLSWDGEKLDETYRGDKHFQTLYSFNIDITGSRMDIARKRFSLGRLSKQQRKMDPVNKLSSVKRLYWENSIIMLLRAPLPFYRAMSFLTQKQQESLIDLHGKLVKKSKKQSDGVITVRIGKDKKITQTLEQLTPPTDKTDRRPRFVACLKLKEPDKEKVKYQIGLGALTMFTMFLLGFEREHLDEKAQRAEKAVCEVIELSGYWTVIESNTDVTQEGGEVITEIDVIARSKINPDVWITFEVKDFSFWRGWVWGQGSEIRKDFYLKAIGKLPVKEEFITNKHHCESLTSFIVTSIPEPFETLEGIKMIYLSDLSEELVKLSGNLSTPRKRHSSSNFLIRYFERLQKDYLNAEKLIIPNKELQKTISKEKEKLCEYKDEYEKIRETYQLLSSEHDTLKVSRKLASKRLVRDSGEKHFQLEKELQNIEKMISKSQRERGVKVKILRELKNCYKQQFHTIKKLETESQKITNSIERLLGSRLF
ncbi:MAG: nuclease-related domain-containing protein [Candidatus Kariarchaeaceae archaeon]